MSNWQQRRQMLLTFTFASVVLTLGRFIIDPSAGNKPVTSPKFPSVVPLSEWLSLESRPLAVTVNEKVAEYAKNETVVSSHLYRYTQDRQQLDIETHYIVGTLGNIHSYLSYYTPIPQQTVELKRDTRYQQGMGFFSLFVFQKRSHLVACINPRGGSTVTPTQFFANRRTHDLQLQRMLPWFLGKESLIDRRCLWVHLSLPLEGESAEMTYPVLEKAWRSWYQWWIQHFPQHE